MMKLTNVCGSSPVLMSSGGINRELQLHCSQNLENSPCRSWANPTSSPQITTALAVPRAGPGPWQRSCCLGASWGAEQGRTVLPNAHRRGSRSWRSSALLGKAREQQGCQLCPGGNRAQPNHGVSRRANMSIELLQVVVLAGVLLKPLWVPWIAAVKPSVNSWPSENPRHFDANYRFHPLFSLLYGKSVRSQFIPTWKEMSKGFYKLVNPWPLH